MLEENPDTFRARLRGVTDLKADKTILTANQPHPYLYVLHSGWAYAAVRLRNGRRQIIDYYLPGDMLLSPGKLPGVDGLDWYYKSLTDVSLCVLDASLFLTDIRQDEALFTRYFEFLNDRIKYVVTLLTDVGCRRASGRVAQFLLYLEARLRRAGLSADGAFDFPVSQEHLAATLGMTNVHVNRTMRELRDCGAIEFSKGKMAILNADALSKIAEEH